MGKHKGQGHLPTPNDSDKNTGACILLPIPIGSGHLVLQREKVFNVRVPPHPSLGFSHPNWLQKSCVGWKEVVVNPHCHPGHYDNGFLATCVKYEGTWFAKVFSPKETH